MLARERRRHLLNEIALSGRVVTSEFAARQGVSEVTVRADLDQLEKQGRVTRTHGGAIAAEVAAPIEEFDIRLGLHREAKQRIASAAARFIASDQSVILDSGTTVHHLAQCITGVSGLTVYTPALPAAQNLMRTDGVEVHLMGGRVRPSWLQTVGTARQLGIKDVIVDTLFLGIHGIDDDLDLIENDLDLVETKRRLIRRARRIILLVDGSKWSTPGRLKVADLRRVDVIVTDAEPPDHVVDRLGGEVQVLVV